MAQSLALPLNMNLSTEGGLAAYLRAVNTLPILDAREERALALRYRQHGDLEAARQLVLSHLRYVVRVARGFSGYGLPQADLIQEGNIGLMKAVKHYDPAHGVRLLSFAVHWIRAEIYEFVLRNWRIVKVATTKAQRKLFFNLRKSRRRIGWMTRHETAALARDLGVPVETVQEMEARLGHADVPYDGHDDAEDEEFRAAPAGYLQDMRYNPETIYSRRVNEQERDQHLSTALATLDARSRDIIERRWLHDDKPTLHELADEYGISAERVRQIEARALARMKDAIAVQP
jgi:RNA polymerase sigma-32 factor